MKGRRPDEALRREALARSLRVVRDALASGASVRQALARAAADPTSPFAPASRELSAGVRVEEALRRAAAETDDPEVVAAAVVLRAHARSGGDPVPALAQAEERLRRQAAADREARALTTQSRLSARAILLLTPGFLGLLLVVDPSGTAAALLSPGGAVAVVAGLLLQVAGGAWIGRIVRGPGPGSSRWRRVPVLRAVVAVVAGRPERPPVAEDVARAAEIVALLLDAGLAPSRAIAAAAPAIQGPFGIALRRARDRLRSGTRTAEALADVAQTVPEPEVERFVDAVEASLRLGVPLAPTLRTLAADVSEERRTAAAERARAVSVRVLLPLGLLILPAFVLACLVPLILGGLGGITS